MSDGIRKAIGTGLILLALITGLAGFFPFPDREEYRAAGREIPVKDLSVIPRVSESDPVNTGDLYELTELPGVGETIAGMILDERGNNGLFIYPEDLLAVKGIGNRKLEAIRPLLIMETTESGE